MSLLYSATVQGNNKSHPEGFVLFCAAALPLGFILGIAAQAAFLYVFGILLPASVYFRQSNLQQTSARFLSHVGWSLLGMYVVFPLSNIWNGLFLHSVDFTNGLYAAKGIYLSRFSSQLLLSGLLLVAFSFIFNSTRRIALEHVKNELCENFSDKILNTFILFSCLSSFLIFIYATFQHFTGFDYRFKEYILPPEHILKNGTYRVFGFFGHPLSFASGMLAIYSFHINIALYNIEQFILSKNKHRFLIVVFTITTLLDFLCILFSGGRTAFIVAILFLILLPFKIKVPTRLKKAKKKFLALIGILGISVLALSPLKDRFLEISENLAAKGIGEDRVLFWKVHLKIFKDYIFFGRGAFWLDHGIREKYYVDLGLEKLVHKYNAHNIYLEVLSCVGIMGAAALLFFLLHTIKTIKKINLSETQNLFFKSLLIAGISNLLHGLTQNTFFDASVTSIYLGMLWILTWSILFSKKLI